MCIPFLEIAGVFFKSMHLCGTSFGLCNDEAKTWHYSLVKAQFECLKPRMLSRCWRGQELKPWNHRCPERPKTSHMSAVLCEIRMAVI